MSYTILVCGTKKAASWGGRSQLSIHFCVFCNKKTWKKMLIFSNIQAVSHTGCRKECVPDGPFCSINIHIWDHLRAQSISEPPGSPVAPILCFDHTSITRSVFREGTPTSLKLYIIYTNLYLTLVFTFNTTNTTNTTTVCLFVYTTNLYLPTTTTTNLYLPTTTTTNLYLPTTTIDVA